MADTGRIADKIIFSSQEENEWELRNGNEAAPIANVLPRPSIVEVESVEAQNE